MSETIKQLAVVSRAEFLLPNLGSLIMGLAWGANTSMSLSEMIILVALSFTVINLSSAIGAQANTISDYSLDLKDDRKKELVQALDKFGHNRLKRVMVVEFVAALALIVLLTSVKAMPVFLLLWVAGISLGGLYSAPPLRIKSRSWLAPVTLVLVLAVFPILFAYFVFTRELDPLFLIALAGLASTVYGVIVPTEIRDYFGDKAMNIRTMTVRLGLAKASLLSIALLGLGGTLIGGAFFVTLINGQYPVLGLSVLAIVAADAIVLRKLKRLYTLSKEYEHSNRGLVDEEIVSFSSDNPKWIMLVTQTYSIISVLMLASKFLH
jgi:4-hydroxybenzoate polyprenyltransferase